MAEEKHINPLKRKDPKIDQKWIEERPLSPSSGKAFRKSPKHYMEYMFGPKEEKPAYTLGNLFDVLITNPENLEKETFLYTKPNLRSNAGKEEWEKIKEEAKGRTLVTQEDLDIANMMIESANSVKTARELIEGRTKGQQKLTWRNKKLNIPMTGYVDFESNAWGEDFVVEVKTCGKDRGDPDQFIRDALKFGYDIQVGGYADGYHKSKFRFPNFVFLVVETTPPFNTSVIFCDSKFMELAKKEWIGTVTAFRFCMDRNLFHMGYDFRLHTMPYFTMAYPNWHKLKFSDFNPDNI